MLQYGEFRRGFGGDTSDTRLVVYGIRYMLEHYVHRRWTHEDVARADAFYRSVHTPTTSRTNARCRICLRACTAPLAVAPPPPAASSVHAALRAAPRAAVQVSVAAARCCR
jgi:hypothetical protein